MKDQIPKLLTWYLLLVIVEDINHRMAFLGAPDKSGENARTKSNCELSGMASRSSNLGWQFLGIDCARIGQRPEA